MNPWKAPSEVTDILNEVKNEHHARLADASICVSFDDSKPFIKNKINFGKVTKFSPLAKLWQGQKHDFCISIPMDLWKSILKSDQKKAYLDLQLSRCEVEYIPEEVEENGKKKKIKDEWGRIQYTQQIKLDDEGNPKWKVEPLGIDIFIENIRRFGLWMDSLEEIAQVIKESENKLKN